MKRLVVYIILLFSLVFDSLAQQTFQFSQYSFNNFGHNPAFAGTKKCFDFRGGARLQWLGMEGAPRTNFASIQMLLTKKHYANKGKHAVGLYLEQDRIHVTSRTYIKGAYAYHKKLARKLTGAVGIFGGVQQLSVDNVFKADNGDPVLANASGSVFLYPEFMPGALIYNNRFYLGLSIAQLYPHKMKIAGPKQKYRNHYFLTAGHKSIYRNVNFYKSFLLKLNRLSPPALDLNMAWEFKNTVTFGLGYRVGEAAIATIKLRLLGAFVIGYAFDFPLNKLRAANAMGHEIMFGFNKCGSGDGAGSASDKMHTCPAYN
jgi:type IX secretion system PorP/SprF family membrane protein